MRCICVHGDPRSHTSAVEGVADTVIELDSVSYDTVVSDATACEVGGWPINSDGMFGFAGFGVSVINGCSYDSAAEWSIFTECI